MNKGNKSCANCRLAGFECGFCRELRQREGMSGIVRPDKVETSGGHCEYYHCPVPAPANENQEAPYIANCEDLIQALGMSFDEGCEFKSLWRRARARQGYVKGETTAVRDAYKAVHYANRVLAYELRKAGNA